jgi:hypothetical protein
LGAKSVVRAPLDDTAEAVGWSRPVNVAFPDVIHMLSTKKALSTLISFPPLSNKQLAYIAAKNDYNASVEKTQCRIINFKQ